MEIKEKLGSTNTEGKNDLVMAESISLRSISDDPFKSRVGMELRDTFHTLWHWPQRHALCVNRNSWDGTVFYKIFGTRGEAASAIDTSIATSHQTLDLTTPDLTNNTADRERENSSGHKQ
jgi:hypothetical protein